jgi:3-methyl-2-oxobutanoate hydroxymethyltransferase
VLGLSRYPVPRHAKKYRDFYNEAVSAYKEFSSEVKSGAFPAQKNAVSIKDEEFEKFVEGIDRIRS